MCLVVWTVFYCNVVMSLFLFLLCLFDCVRVDLCCVFSVLFQVFVGPCLHVGAAITIIF